MLAVRRGGAGREGTVRVLLDAVDDAKAFVNQVDKLGLTALLHALAISPTNEVGTEEGGRHIRLFQIL